MFITTYSYNNITNSSLIIECCVLIDQILQAMGPNFAEGITVEKKADATYKVVGAGK
jgi:hypothetical protein